MEGTKISPLSSGMKDMCRQIKITETITDKQPFIQISHKIEMKNTLTLLVLLTLTMGSSIAQADFFHRLADSTLVLTHQRVIYDPSYMVIPYPNGDVAPDRGVCTDVVIRAYRKMGIDLQKEVHEDMRAHFNLYPKNWGLTRPDRNIDHRRVPNLMTFFTRHGTVKKISNNPNDYQPGDIVCWNLGGGITHIGIVTRRKSADGLRYMMVHNIGGGQVLDDCLFSWRIIGVYRYEK
jgi:uncharacterized protein